MKLGWIGVAGAIAAFSGQAAADEIKEKPMRDPDRIVCKVYTVTGSRLAKRKECHTVAEWRHLERVQKSFDQMDRSPGGGTSCPPRRC